MYILAQESKKDLNTVNFFGGTNRCMLQMKQKYTSSNNKMSKFVKLQLNDNVIFNFITKFTTFWVEIDPITTAVIIVFMTMLEK